MLAETTSTNFSHPPPLRRPVSVCRCILCSFLGLNVFPITYFKLSLARQWVAIVAVTMYYYSTLLSMSIFFHFKFKESHFEQTQKRCVSWLFLQNPFPAEKQLVADQASSANQHHLIMPSWLPKTFSWLSKNAFRLNQPAFSNVAPYAIKRGETLLAEDV